MEYLTATGVKLFIGHKGHKKKTKTTNKQINNHSSRKSKKDRQYNRQANICATF